MALLKLTPQPGLLYKLLAERGLTNKEFAKSVHMSRNTTKAVNDGIAKKAKHIQKIADKLGVPVQHLLKSGEANNSQIIASKFEGEPLDNLAQEFERFMDTITYEKADALKIGDQGSGAQALEWSLDLSSINERAVDLLKQFETCVRKYLGFNEFDEWDENLVPSEDEASRYKSLASQINAKLLDEEINVIINKLKEIGIYVYIGGFLKWSKKKGLSLDHGLPPPEAIYYRGKYIAKFIITSSNENSIRKKEVIGNVPPSQASIDGPLVFINGRWLEPKLYADTHT